MSFFVEGDYFEVCNCDVSCNCVWLGSATHDSCDVLLAWHVTSGSKDGVDLSGLNAVMAVHSPKREAPVKLIRIEGKNLDRVKRSNIKAK